MQTNPNLRNLLLSLDLKSLRAEIVRQADEFSLEPGRLEITLPQQWGRLLQICPDTASVISAELMAKYGIVAAVTIRVRGDAASPITGQSPTADETEAIATIGRHLAAFSSECEQSGDLFKAALGAILGTNLKTFSELLFDKICIATGNRASVPQLIEKANHGHPL